MARQGLHSFGYEKPNRGGKAEAEEIPPIFYYPLRNCSMISLAETSTAGGIQQSEGFVVPAFDGHSEVHWAIDVCVVSRKASD